MWHVWERGGVLYRYLFGKREQKKKTLGKPMQRWNDDTEIDL